METMKLSAWGEQYDLCAEIGTYAVGGGVAIQLHAIQDTELEPFSLMTVNIAPYPAKFPKAYVDVNDFPEVEDLIKRYKLGTPTGKVVMAPFCTYPEYSFDFNELAKYTLNPEKIQEFQKQHVGQER